MKDYPKFTPDRIIFEAEDIVKSAAYTIMDEPEASGGKVVIPTKGQNTTNPNTIEKPGLSLEFYAPESTKYLVWQAVTRFMFQAMMMLTNSKI